MPVKTTLFLSFFVAFLLASVSLAAQTKTEPETEPYDGWLQQQKDDFAQFSALQNQGYQQFADASDAEFSQWLTQAWQEYEQISPRKRPELPKPKQQPVAKPLTSNSHKKAAPVHSLAGLQQLSEQLTKQSPALADRDTMQLAFYGHQLHVLKWQVAQPQLSDLKAKAIGTAWQNLAKSNYQPVVTSLKQACAQAQCGDWALLKLVQAYSQAMVIDKPDMQVLVQWFLADKLGLKVRAGLYQKDAAKQQLILLYTPKQQVYGVTFFRIENRDYYPLTPQGKGRLLSYPEGFNPEVAYNRQPLALDFSQTLAAAGPQAERSLLWHQQPQPAELRFRYSLGRVAFFDDYPQLELSEYFAAPLEPGLAASVELSLRPYLSGDDALSQAAGLLTLVQALPYQTDQQQFGRENYLLPEQLLYYPASDCEDRSFFYASLVSSVLQLPVLGVLYPEHVATAIYFAKVESAKEHTEFIYDKKRYVLADPTYLGAGLGQQMQQFAPDAGQLMVKF